MVVKFNESFILLPNILDDENPVSFMKNRPKQLLHKVYSLSIDLDLSKILS